jgi:acetoin:2,6-dichlorophenolindophenol oxidoreductase subunit alpha
MTTRKSKPGAAPADKNGFSLISNEKLLALYAAMLKCRMIERRLGPFAAANGLAILRGREASAAGVLIDLLPEDAICVPRGDAAARLLKGISLKRIFSAVLSSRRRGLDAAAADWNVLPSAEAFADRLEVATRAARLRVRGKKKKVTVLVLDGKEAGSEEWERALCSAAAARLPMLFVCHSGSREGDLVGQALRCGVPAITVDQEDAVAIYRVASEAIAHARRGNGPTLIECKRWMVPAAKSSRQSRGNAIRNMERYLAGKGLLNHKCKAKVVAEFGRELDVAAAKAGDGAVHSGRGSF